MRGFLAICAVGAVALATVGHVLLPPRGNGFLIWLATVFLPALSVVLVVAGRSRRTVLIVFSVVIYAEALLLASQYVIGLAYAVLLPMTAIALFGPELRGRPKMAMYVAAVVVGTLAVSMAEAGVPVNALGSENGPFAIVACALTASFALGLTWRSSERLSRALDDAEREIEARVEAERRFRETAETLERLVASSPVATAAIDADGRVSVWNPAAARLFGWTAGEVVGGRPPFEAAPPFSPLSPLAAEAPPLVESVAAALAGERVSGAIAACATRSGRALLVEVHAAPRRDESGLARGVIVQVTDVTERSALEAQLRQAQKMEAVGNLAGGIAHDVNNTLTAVGGFAEIIAAETREPEVRADAQMISSAVARASELTRRLLAFARRSVLQPQTIDVTEFLAAVRPMLERLLGADVAVVVLEEASGATIKVDPGGFEQAILNLAVNARDAMPGGGRLTIATREERAAGPLEDDAPDWLVVSVSDTGVGIPAELQDQVFEPFVTTKAKGEGTGLGLPMVYGFVKQSGGEVSLRSAVGQGTTVEIRLPRVLERAAPRTKGDAPLPQSVGRESILLIEDEGAVAELVHKVLAGLGYEVLEARGGTQALALARDRDERIDLILSDVIMPGLTGPEAVEAVRRIHPESIALYISGYTADAIAERGVLPRGVELLQKPFTPSELAVRVRATLDAVAVPSA